MNIVDTRLQLNDIYISRIEIQRALFNQKNGTHVTRNGMIKILIKEALSIREEAPESEKDLDALKKRFDLRWGVKNNIEPPIIFSTNRGDARDELMQYIASRGGVVSRKELIKHFVGDLGVGRNTLDQRIWKAVDDANLFAIERGVYAIRDLNNSSHLLESEIAALERIRTIEVP